MIIYMGRSCGKHWLSKQIQAVYAQDIPDEEKIEQIRRLLDAWLRQFIGKSLEECEAEGNITFKS